MKKTISLKGNMGRAGLLFSLVVMAMLIFSLIGIQSVQATISTQLDFGDRGSEVTELQTYLSTNSNIYPSGLVTGYFGPLTQSGVEQFQISGGIVSSGTPLTTGYGRVGPITQAAINAKLTGSVITPSPNTNVSTPTINSVSVDTNSRDASVNWTASRASMGKVYYSTSPIRITNIWDSTGVFVISGNLAHNAGVTSTNHTVNIDNLTPDTRYYYLIVAFDSSFNLSITSPDSFRTTQ